MVPKTIFKLHEPQHGIDVREQRETYIYMFFSYGYYLISEGKEKRKKYIPLKYPTGKKIKPAYWVDRPVYRVKKKAGYDDLLINLHLDRLQDKVQQVYYEFERSGIVPTPAQLKERLDIELKGKDNVPAKSFNEYLQQFIVEASEGKRLTFGKTRYRPLSIKNLKGFQSQITEYQKSRNIILSYEQINVHFLDDFVEFFNQKGYSQNTIARHIKHLKLIMRSAKQEGMHSNTAFEGKLFRVPQIRVDPVYLNESELNRLYNLDLSDHPQLEITRDVFLLGCYLAQHYTDYKAVKKKNLTVLGDGRKALKIYQLRNGKEVIVPLRQEADTILRKYDYELPPTNEQKINEKLQILGKMAGIDEPVTIIINKGGRKKEKSLPKYQFIKTYTARRSGCINMYLANVPTVEIMAISGHKTERDLLAYIKNSNKEWEVAHKLSSHPYFANPELL
ncbi:MAG: site-specific integrase [Chlorobi bacterium]|nr:site-specific integrase [Chlorobiota bacterium]